MLDWLTRFPRRSSTPTRGCCSSQAWVVGAARPRGRHARRRRRARALGGLDEGPLPDGFASLESSLSVLQRDVRLGRRVGDPRARRALRRARGPGLAVAARDHVGARLGATTATATSTRPSAGWTRRRGIAPPADQWIVGVAAIADLSLIAGHARRPRRAAAPRATRRSSSRARSGCSTRVEDGEVHTALRRRAGRPRPPRGGARPSSSRACSCAGCGASRSTSLDGLIALAPTWPRRRRARAAVFAEAEALAGGAAATRACCPRGSRRPPRAAGARRRPTGSRSASASCTVLRLLTGGLLRARDRPASSTSRSTPCTRT